MARFLINISAGPYPKKSPSISIAWFVFNLILLVFLTITPGSVKCSPFFAKKNILNKYSFIENYFKRNDLELMILIRIIPAVPFFAQNLILAGLAADNKKFFYTTLLGLAPWSFIFCSIGQGLEEIFVNQTDISFSLIAQPEYLIPIGTIAFLVVLVILFKKKFKN